MKFKIATITTAMVGTALLLGSCGRKSFEEQTAERAKDFTTKQCPKEMDQCTTIDSMIFDKDTRTIQYYYTLKGNLDDPEALNECLIEDFRENMLLKLRDDLSLKKEKENKLNFSYFYFSKSTGNRLMEISFTPDDYTGKIQLHTFNYRQTRNMKQFTKTQCPVEQADGTTLDSLWYDSISRTLHYDYTLHGSELDNDSLLDYNPTLPQALKKELVKSVKNDQSLVEARDKEHINYEFRYYTSVSKKKIIDVNIKGTEVE